MFGDLIGRLFVTPAFLIGKGAHGATQFLPLVRNAPVSTAGGQAILNFFGSNSNVISNVDLFLGGQRIPAGTVLSASQINQLLASSKLPLGGTSVSPLIKIVENESALPMDRVYANYNYYNDVFNSLRFPGEPPQQVHQGLVGIERTLCNGNASIGARLPFVYLNGDDNGNFGGFGDLELITKYALINCCETGTVLSIGLVVSVPTGRSFAPSGIGTVRIHDTEFQPFLGVLCSLGPCVYFQGFSSIFVPTDDNDVTLVANDLAIGYFLYRCSNYDGLLHAVVPTVELHVNTPLTHRGALSEPAGFPNIIDFTGGVTFELCRNSTLGIAAVVPVTGPRPFDIEGQAYLNLRY
jgi:hypothetical protein